MKKSRFRIAGFVSLLALITYAPPVAVPTDAQAQFFGRNQQAAAQAAQETQMREAARLGVVMSKALSPTEALRQSRLLTTALAKLKPERRGVTDAFVVAIGLDSDGVLDVKPQKQDACSIVALMASIIPLFSPMVAGPMI
jgi:hypothetical protein